MQALQKKIDTIANNMSNMNTVGYKSREVFFEDILFSRLQQSDKLSLEGRKTPLGLNQGYGSKVSLTFADFSQGQMINTGIDTDFMLEGEDIFFTVVSPDQDSLDLKNLRFTRNGHFQLDASRYLVTDQGDYVLNREGEPINIPENSSLHIDTQGRIMVQYNNGESEELGVIQLTRIMAPQALEETGNNQYKIAETLIDQEIDVIDEAFDLLNEDNVNRYAVIQGSLEAANIDFVKEMVQLNEVQRAYQFQSKGISIADQMMGIANNIKG